MLDREGGVVGEGGGEEGAQWGAASRIAAKAISEGECLVPDALFGGSGSGAERLLDGEMGREGGGGGAEVVTNPDLIQNRGIFTTMLSGGVARGGAREEGVEEEEGGEGGGLFDEISPLARASRSATSPSLHSSLFSSTTLPNSASTCMGARASLPPPPSRTHESKGVWLEERVNYQRCDSVGVECVTGGGWVLFYSDGLV